MFHRNSWVVFSTVFMRMQFESLSQSHYTVSGHTALWADNRQRDVLQDSIKKEMKGRSVSNNRTVDLHHRREEPERLSGRYVYHNRETEPQSTILIVYLPTIKLWDLQAFCMVHDSAKATNLPLELCEHLCESLHKM